MAIPCPSCGREYDVTLFQFGRTIHCTCGSRVGMEKRLGPGGKREIGGEGAPRRFLADAMLGHLARWLRIMGYDTAWEQEAEDGELVRRALEEERTLLTRDRRLPEEWRVRNVLVLDEEHPSGQIRQVVGRLGLSWRDQLFTRCSRCNEPLVGLTAEEVRMRQEGRDRPVPDRILERADTFRRCPSCGRVYWEGSHTDRIRRRLERLLAG
jgi:uncharacterized protein